MGREDNNSRQKSAEVLSAEIKQSLLKGATILYKTRAGHLERMLHVTYCRECHVRIGNLIGYCIGMMENQFNKKLGSLETEISVGPIRYLFEAFVVNGDILWQVSIGDRDDRCHVSYSSSLGDHTYITQFNKEGLLIYAAKTKKEN